MKSMGNELSHWEAPPNPAGREEPLFDSQVARAYHYVLIPPPAPTRRGWGMRAETLSVKKWSYCCDWFQDKCMNKYIYPGLSFFFLLKSELNSWLESTLNEWMGMLGGSDAAHHITRWCKPALPLMDRFTVRSGLQQVNAIMVIPMNIIITVQTISSPVHHVHRWWPPDHLKYYIIF